MADTERMLRVPAELRELGAMKLTFVGGEPLLHPALPRLVAAAKVAGLTTCVVTNGSLLDARLLDKMRGSLDWLTLSVDASTDELHARIGRGLARDISVGAPFKLCYLCFRLEALQFHAMHSVILSSVCRCQRALGAC